MGPADPNRKPMNPKPNLNAYGMPLVQGADAARQATLERMRGKLAGQSQDILLRERKRISARRGKAFGWAWRIALCAAFLGANASLIDFKREAPAAKAAKRAPAVERPKGLSANEEALYWTYALYDFDRLRSRFGAPGNAVVDARVAKSRLAELLPKADRETRNAILKYLPKGGLRA
jgi:hypothetical protein